MPPCSLFFLMKKYQHNVAPKRKNCPQRKMRLSLPVDTRKSNLSPRKNKMRNNISCGFFSSTILKSEFLPPLFKSHFL